MEVTEEWNWKIWETQTTGRLSICISLEKAASRDTGAGRQPVMLCLHAASAFGGAYDIILSTSSPRLARHDARTAINFGRGSRECERNTRDMSSCYITNASSRAHRFGRRLSLASRGHPSRASAPSPYPGTATP